MGAKQLGVGLVSIDENGFWPGGRYHLHQIIRSVALLPESERLPMRPVWWYQENKNDTSFDQVDDFIENSVVIRSPERMFARIRRRISRTLKGSRDFADLFHDAGIGVLFPTSSCEKPGVPLIYLLTDLQHKRRPDLFSMELLEWFEINFSRKLAEAEIIVASSKDVLNDLQTYYGEFAFKARLLPCASLPQPEWFALAPSAVAAKFGLRKKYFIISNEFTEHKNYLTVFEAIRLLKKAGVDLQIACTGQSRDYKGKNHVGRLSRFIEEHGLVENIKILGFLPRAEQMALVRGAHAVVQPSLFEGWSNPIEEARSLGRPLIMSDIPIHREKCEDIIATLVDPTRPEGWAEALFASSEATPISFAEVEPKAMNAAHIRALNTGKAFVAIAQEAMARVRSRQLSVEQARRVNE